MKFTASTTLLSLVFTLCFGSLTLSAQSFTGTVTSASTGEPLPFASIYVQETGSGTVTNENGRYLLKLGSGNYTLVFQYLGYATEVRNVRAGGNQGLDVELQTESFDLETIEVIDGGEDASYSVIRRAIAKADYHLNQVDTYSADVYIKGSGRVKKVAKLLLAMVPKEDREEIDTSRVFTSESVSKITYKRPNTFEQEVISAFQVGDSPVDATPYLFTSFYQPKIADAVSPLSHRAFSYYRFEHQGLFNDRGLFVNKIKVSPRSRGEDVFSGYINIVEGSWAIHSLELEVYKLGFRFLVTQTYAPIEERVWMPVSTTADVDGSIFGITLEGNYISTVSNYDIALNPDLPAYVEVIDEKTKPEAAAEVRKANQTRDFETTLAEGGELTRKEMRRLMREYEKRERKVAEAPQVERNYTFTQDSVQGTRDTAFWENVRPVPLTPLEKRGYAIQDSLSARDTLNLNLEPVVNEGPDGTFIANSRKKSSGIQLSLPDFDFFNAVEGYAAGINLSYQPKLPKGKVFRAKVHPRYGFAWKRATVDGELTFQQFKDKKRTNIWLKGGRSLRQFDESPAMDPLLNTFTMLFNYNNYLGWYERVFGRLSFERKVKPEVVFSGGIGYEDRRRVFNNTDAGWLNTGEEGYRPNNPFVLEEPLTSVPIPLAAAATYNFGVALQPGLRYEINDGRKSVIPNSAPTIHLNYFGGVQGISESLSAFHHLQASYEHRFEMGIRGNVNLMVRGGAFLSNEFVQLPDFRHFATSEISLTTADPIGSYRLLPFYNFSTNQEYLEFYGHYQFRKFLLSRIWKLQKAGIREDLFVNYLYTPESDHYAELGYTIDNIFRILRVEFVTSWQDFKYRDFGVRLSVASIFERLSGD